MRSSSALLPALALAGLACQDRAPPGPTPLAIAPDQVYQDQLVQVRITGQGFVPYLNADFLAPSQSSLDTAFQAWLGSTPLVAVTLQADGSLTATVPPGLTPGTYDLTVVDPGQGSAAARTGTLPAAFLVLNGQLCDAGPSCLVCGGIDPTECGDRCVSLQTDGQNCGACGQACPPGEVCSGGTCSGRCASPYATCVDGGYCADTLIDPSNCGGCGALCPPASPLCSGGSCSASCVDPYGQCGQGPLAYCADFGKDPANCGGCGMACDGGAQCVAGVCAPACGGAVGTLCGTACVDVATDDHNCGGCGVVCPSGQACSDAHCACPPARPDACGGDGGVESAFCTKLADDAANCGACGDVCAPGQGCVDAGCVCPLALPDLCGGGDAGESAFCTSLADDPANCHACGHVCPDQECCSGVCTDTLTDVHNCLACGNVCGASQFCDADAGCVSLPPPCLDGGAKPLDGDGRSYSGPQTGCAHAELDTGHPPDCDDAGALAAVGCVQDALLNDGGAADCLSSYHGGWFYFASDAGHDALLAPTDGGAPRPGDCNTEFPGYLVTGALLPSPVGVPTPGFVCFAGLTGDCLDDVVQIAILNCGSMAAPRYVYQLPDFPGQCGTAAPYCSEIAEPGNVGAYCTQ